MKNTSDVKTKKKRVFNGWFIPKQDIHTGDLPDEGTIKFGQRKWFPNDVRVKITVEWSTPPKHD